MQIKKIKWVLLNKISNNIPSVPFFPFGRTSSHIIIFSVKDNVGINLFDQAKAKNSSFLFPHLNLIWSGKIQFNLIQIFSPPGYFLLIDIESFSFLFSIGLFGTVHNLVEVKLVRMLYWIRGEYGVLFSVIMKLKKGLSSFWEPSSKQGFPIILIHLIIHIFFLIIILIGGLVRFMIGNLIIWTITHYWRTLLSLILLGLRIGCLNKFVKVLALHHFVGKLNCVWLIKFAGLLHFCLELFLRIVHG